MHLGLRPTQLLGDQFTQFLNSVAAQDEWGALESGEAANNPSSYNFPVGSCFVLPDTCAHWDYLVIILRLKLYKLAINK